MIAAILEVKREVLKTEGNRNNLLGLPLTVLGIREHHEVGVVELGISERGEMTRLVEIAQPDVALLTNIGISHIASLGGFQGVAAAKGELFQALKEDGIEVINFDDLWIVEMTAKTKRRQITYSVEEKADVSLKGFEVKGRASDMMAATFSLFGDEIAVEARGVGSYNLSNAAAAIATAHALGCGKEEIVEGLSQFVPMKNRMEPIQLDGITLLDDTYNANPDSMEAALRTLSEYPGRKIAVLGDMLELGDIARNIHRRMGSLAARMEVEKLIIYGEFKGEVHEGAVDEGMDEGSSYTVESKDDAVGVLKEIINDGDVVLVKGSRGMGMEEVVEKLREEFST
jgi:UDP-N-acetylmuramoyl-tripeptide--D-alanyl-D-alanine ligase